MHLKVGRWILNILPYLLSYTLGSFYQGIPQKELWQTFASLNIDSQV